MRMPSLARVWAVARPMPREAPVTSAVLIVGVVIILMFKPFRRNSRGHRDQGRQTTI
jgi:hypothetical protein